MTHVALPSVSLSFSLWPSLRVLVPGKMARWHLLRATAHLWDCKVERGPQSPPRRVQEAVCGPVPPLEF